MTSHRDDSICLKIGVTAHRDLSHADSESIAKQTREFFIALQNMFPDLPLVIVNPLATGGDTLVARVAADMGLALEVPLPMPIAEYEKDFEDPYSLQEFQALLQQATVFELPLVSGNSLESIREDRDARNLQYAQLGTYVAGHSHILLALWDGKNGHKPGGTASVVNFQLHDEMSGITGERGLDHLLADKESDLIYHIHCPRSEQATRTCGRWLSNETVFENVKMPEKYQLAFLHLQDFRLDGLKYREAIGASGISLLEHEDMSTDPNLSEIDSAYQTADWLAIRYRGFVERELLFTHVLAVLMGASFIIYSEYVEFSLLLPAFLVFFFAALSLNKMAGYFQWHRKYLDNRALAEGLRVQFYWTLAGIEDSDGAAFTYDNMMQKQDVELVWIRHVMRSVGSSGRVNADRVGNGLDLAVNHWIGDAQAGTGQLGYYDAASLRRQKKLQRNEFYGTLTLWAGISIALLLLVIGSRLDDTATNILFILMGLLPLTAGIRQAYAYKKADKELTKQYQFMHKTFSNAQRQSIAARSDPVMRERVLRALGEACLEEHSEWILIHRERPLEHSGLHA
ncbi:MAG: hypothetical protein ABJL54_03420 [Halioglobus sp.]